MDALTLARWQFGVTTVYHFFFVSIVLAYQGWIYWVFRRRIGRETELEY
jgi:cytochrome d ubiquinol oxidase subunit II